MLLLDLHLPTLVGGARYACYIPSDQRNYVRNSEELQTLYALPFDLDTLIALLTAIVTPPVQVSEDLFESVKHTVTAHHHDREVDKQEDPSTLPLAQPHVVRFALDGGRVGDRAHAPRIILSLES